MPSHLGFLSYPSRYRTWVEALHGALEGALGPGTVWLDCNDIRPGRSWSNALQAGSAAAGRVVLVAAPETFASPWVQLELDSFLQTHRHWREEGRIQLALVGHCVLPPFLATTQHLDFRGADETTRRASFERLVAALRGLANPDAAAPLPAGVDVPSVPDVELAPADYDAYVGLLAPLLDAPAAREALAARLDLRGSALDGHGTSACAANAALVEAAAGGPLAAGAVRALEHALDLRLPAPPADVELRRLRDRLAAPSPPALPAAPRIDRPAELVFPTGAVPTDSPLYVRRETDDAAERELSRSPRLVHIVGPRQMGKTSLLARLAERARAAAAGPLVVTVNLQTFDTATVSSLKPLLVNLCGAMLRAAGRDPALAREIETSPFAPAETCADLVAKHVFSVSPGGVLLCIDETERVVRPDGCAHDFFSMLRAWHENGKLQPEPWDRLRIALCFSTEAYLQTDGLAESPLYNVGLKCRLRDLRRDEVERLAPLHGLDPADVPVAALMDWLGGNPYLVRRVLYAFAVERVDFPQILDEARRLEGPLGDCLSSHLRNVKHRPGHAEALRAVLAGRAPRGEVAIRALEGAGLIRRAGASFVPRYRLYADVLGALL